MPAPAAGAAVDPSRGRRGRHRVGRGRRRRRWWRRCGWRRCGWRRSARLGHSRGDGQHGTPFLHLTGEEPHLGPRCISLEREGQPGVARGQRVAHQRGDVPLVAGWRSVGHADAGDRRGSGLGPVEPGDPLLVPGDRWNRYAGPGRAALAQHLALQAQLGAADSVFPVQQIEPQERPHGVALVGTCVPDRQARLQAESGFQMGPTANGGVRFRRDGFRHQTGTSSRVRFLASRPATSKDPARKRGQCANNGGSDFSHPGKLVEQLCMSGNNCFGPPKNERCANAKTPKSRSV